MERRLIEYITPPLRTNREMDIILDTCEQPEVEQLWAASEVVENNQFFETMDLASIRRYEAMMKIVPLSIDTLETRRFRIYTRWNANLPYTIRALLNMLDTLCGKDGHATVLQNKEYRLVVRMNIAVKSAYDSVVEMLERIVPCNIVIDVSIIYNTHATVGKYTHRQLAARTHRQIKEEVM